MSHAAQAKTKTKELLRSYAATLPLNRTRAMVMTLAAMYIGERQTIAARVAAEYPAQDDAQRAARLMSLAGAAVECGAGDQGVKYVFMDGSTL